MNTQVTVSATSCKGEVQRVDAQSMSAAVRTYIDLIEAGVEGKPLVEEPVTHHVTLVSLIEKDGDRIVFAIDSGHLECSCADEVASV